MIYFLSRIIFSILIFMALFRLYDIYFNNLTYVKSKADGRKYKVRNITTKDKAADLLAELRSRLERLCGHIKNKYGKEHQCVKLIQKRFKPNNISETPEHSKNTSYSVNKGEQLVFCIRPREQKEELHEVNLLMFVAIHELAHVGSISIGHNDEFYDNFVFLLKEAVEIGVYQKIDFDRNNKEYCGMTITSSPI
jgi:hypothetical protein